jgi:pimeloyl-ACP methyl ester carboxylesterase
MNRHSLIDQATASVAAIIAGKRKFFSRSLESRPFRELTGQMEVSLPDFGPPFATGTYPVEAHLPQSNLVMDPAFRIEKWIGADHPTILFHHGSNERPFDYRNKAKNSFCNIFVTKRDAFPANLVAVRAPFYNGPLREYQENMTHLSRFMAMIAVSVKLNETLVSILKKHGNAPVITCGISLGGWVANLHRALHNTADNYIPLMAGAFLGEVFLQSSYRKLTGQRALAQPETLRELLNFNRDFDQITTANVHPLLARHDRFIEYEVQAKSYGNHPIRTIDFGHVTGALQAKVIRDHIMDVLKTCAITPHAIEQKKGESLNSAESLPCL